ncbi:filamentous hemagglutinin N-terminal domain-containing protein [Cupriavidus sp. 30B13]|uniref:two-partner secretion domain-containing protein n=1 Tax=Cupriavidus sp. 30B13 TaxID=3384241 RepID=UPI003B8ECEAA
MNKNYALVWNQSQGCWNVASEGTRRHRKPGSAKRLIAAAAAVLGLGALATAHALPAGQSIAYGSGNVLVYNGGKNMSVNQSTDKMIINWDTFDIGGGESVTFNQLNNTSVALNRVVTSAGSNILGNLNANGRVFVVNPTGVVFGSSAQVNVGGLVASTQNISDADFVNGNYHFAGGTGGPVSNLGTINAPGGNVALLGSTVTNNGVIQAQMGRVALGAGNDFTVSFDPAGLLNLQVNGGLVGSLAQNGGLLRADGGQVLMTSRAAGSLQQAVVNNTGIIEAKTLQGNAGTITLDGGTDGVVRVAGSLNASALAGPGTGGTIETRGADVQVQLATQVSTQANNGQTGVWRISSADVNVNQTPNVGGSTVLGDTLSRSLGTTNVELASTTGNLSVNAPVGWSSGNKLTLASAADVNLNGATLTAAGAGAGVIMNAAGDVNLSGSKVTLGGAGGGLEVDYGPGRALRLSNGSAVTLSGTGASFKSNGYFYNVIQNLAQLQAINNNLSGYYVLGTNIRGGSMKGIGTDYGLFSGIFEGLGNTLSNLSVTGNGPFVGLFGVSSGRISNLNLASLTINAPSSSSAGLVLVGGLVGMNSGQIANVNATGMSVNSGYYASNSTGGLVGLNTGTIDGAALAGYVYGNAYSQSVGGLVGENFGTVTNSQTNASLSGSMQRNPFGGVGGLVGMNAGTVVDSSSLGNTSTSYGGLNVGGLVGYNRGGTIARAFSAGTTGGNGASNTGGLVGFLDGGSISDSYASGRVNGYGGAATGGLVGWSQGGSLANVRATGMVSDSYGASVGGLIGTHASGTIVSAEATGAVSGGSNSRVGGLVGSMNGGSALVSVARGKVSAGSNSHAGGLVGYSGGDLVAVEASGEVYAGGNSFVGGLVGTNVASGAGISSGVASGNVKGESRSAVGGLIGQNNGKVVNSSAAGMVSGGSYAMMGGLVGMNSGLVEQSLASGKVNVLSNYGQIYGGLVGVNLGVMKYNTAAGSAALVPLAGVNYGTIQ